MVIMYYHKALLTVFCYRSLIYTLLALQWPTSFCTLSSELQLQSRSTSFVITRHSKSRRTMYCSIVYCSIRTPGDWAVTFPLAVHESRRLITFIKNFCGSEINITSYFLTRKRYSVGLADSVARGIVAS